MQFKRWLNEDWTTPDDLYSPSPGGRTFTTFIAFPGKPINYGGDTHIKIIGEMIGCSPSNDNRCYENCRALWDKWQNEAFFGRVGPLTHFRPIYSVQYIISLWNEDKSLYAHLDECLRKLISDGAINPDYVDKYTVSTPMGEFKVSDRLNPASSPQSGQNQVSPEDIKLLKQLHLMPPDQKKNALMHIGVRGKQSRWPGVSPGQKWWAMSSEDII